MENARLQWMEVLEAELRLQPDGVRFQPHKLANLFMGPLFLERFIQWIVRAYDQEASLLSWLECVVPDAKQGLSFPHTQTVQPRLLCSLSEGIVVVEHVESDTVLSIT
jgi:hypothetical protein